jgi:hypothetical protein
MEFVHFQISLSQVLLIGQVSDTKNDTEISLIDEWDIFTLVTLSDLIDFNF